MRSVITEHDIPDGGVLRVAVGTIFTPSARDRAVERGVRIEEVEADRVQQIAPPGQTVAIGADHGGFPMKQLLKPLLEEYGLTVRDVGTYQEEPVDYPDIAIQVAELVASGAVGRGIIVDGAGTGSAIAANKVPGIRAALCYDKPSARNSREHNDANVLTLGGRSLTGTQAEDVIRTWLTTPFAGGRHAARLQKISEIEKRYSR